MKTIGEVLKSGLLVIALTMTFGSIFAPLAVAEVRCKEDPGDECVLSSGDILEDWDEKDAELE
jgi:hypothetical protein